VSVFGLYARYYDLLYRDKDYAAEAAFVSERLRTYSPAARSLLELGCGTGRHAFEFAGRGWETHGIDLSEGMVEAAQSRRRQAAPELAARVNFAVGDIRTVRLRREFDCVVSLFHVISYQTATGDLLAAFATAASHLKPGGVFLFDFWYGPAVLTDRPTIRVKRLQDEVIEVTRIAEPEMCPNDNVVRVRYHLFLKEAASGRVAETQETHAMRYLFLPEIEQLLASQRFELLWSGAWMQSSRPLGADAWYGCVAARLQG
jgi:SAM-dependent methyltransferase